MAFWEGVDRCELCEQWLDEKVASVKHSHAGRAVCTYAYAVRKRPWCVLIGACVLNRSNTI